MRVISILTHSTTLLWLQQMIIIWFTLDFFLARNSSTTNKLFKGRATEPASSNDLIEQIETTAANLRSGFRCHDLLIEEPTFDKVILIVIDALGAEFIPSITVDADSVRQKHVSAKQYRMPFVEQSLANNKAMAFIAKAATPTVTMPRIKALVSGTIPSFMDVIYNLVANDVSNFPDDNLLHLARAKGKSLVFYGDDTWLSLFDKTMFKRSRETLSLFASDYTSVDTNVTEMALPETKRNPIDWDYLILHYLGLDHIGHSFGSNEAALIDEKLMEMDDVIKEIYNDMSAKPDTSLIIVCGDHGMSRQGNHGGDTPLESETAMIFIPVNRQLSKSSSHSGGGEKRIQQIDFAVTLSLLNGLAIPKMSNGVIIEKLLRSLWNDDVTKQTCAIIDNLEQMSKQLGDGGFSSVSEGSAARVSKLLDRMASNTTVDNTRSFIQQALELARDIQAQQLTTVVPKSNSILVMLVLGLIMFLSLINMRKSCIRLLMPLMTTSQKLTCLGALAVPILMQGSTDFIEMEHALWPLYAICLFALFCLSTLQSSIDMKHISQDLEVHRLILFIVTFTISASWNNLSFLGSQEWGWSLPVISIIIMCNFTRQTSALKGKETIIFFGTGLLVFATKMVEETSERHDHNFTLIAYLQLFALFGLVLITLANICTSFAKQDNQATAIVQKLATSWMWLVLLLSRSRNYVFLISNVIMEASLNSLLNTLRLSPISRAILYLIFSSNAFYGQGNTNQFSSLDIKPAFFGQTQYNIVLAVPLVACATFGSQIYWYIKLFQRVQGEKEQERMVPKHTSGGGSVGGSTLIPAGTKDAIKDFVDMRNFLTIGYYLYVCGLLRNHLFIWSVLSPKLVYLFMTTLSLRLTTTVISHAPHLLDKIFLSRSTALKSQYRLLEV